MPQLPRSRYQSSDHQTFLKSAVNAIYETLIAK